MVGSLVVVVVSVVVVVVVVEVVSVVVVVEVVSVVVVVVVVDSSSAFTNLLVTAEMKYW